MPLCPQVKRTPTTRLYGKKRLQGEQEQVKERVEKLKKESRKRQRPEPDEDESDGYGGGSEEETAVEDNVTLSASQSKEDAQERLAAAFESAKRELRDLSDMFLKSAIQARHVMMHVRS